MLGLSSTLSEQGSAPADGTVLDLGDSSTYPNLTSFQAPRWLNDPAYRGSASLIWSCVFTLCACFYTAIRPNVPARTSKARDRAQDRVFLLVAAVVFPEYLLRYAQVQFYQAFWLRETLNELLESSSSKRKLRPYTLPFCFYVVMGGISIADGDRRISAAGVAELARLGHFVDIDEGWLTRNARSTIFLGPLVFLQATWFLLQCITRVCVGLQVSLLEIHTLMGMYVAALIAAMWSYKPNGIYTTHPLSAESLPRDATTQDHLERLLPETPFSTPPPRHVPNFWEDNHHALAAPHSRLRTRPWLLSPTRLSGPRLFITLAAAYSALPLVAWRYAFPSRAEAVAWKTTSLFLVGLWLYAGAMVRGGTQWFGRVDVLLGRRPRRLAGPRRRAYDRFVDALTRTVGLLLLCLFGAAKVMLLVLPLVGLRYMSVAMFVVPSWVMMIPHV